MPPRRAIPAVVDMRSPSTKRVKEDGEACEPVKRRRPVKQGCNCPLDCELNSGMPREFCLNHSDETPQPGKAPSASLGVVAQDCLPNAGMPRGGTPPKVLRNKHGQAICPPGCPRVGKVVSCCRTHGGKAMCPIGCTANKTKGMLKANCPEHQSRKPQVGKKCPPGCPRAGKLAESCRAHGGWAMCPIGCTANKTKGMLKKYCPKHQSEAARKSQVLKKCPPECQRAGRLAGYCEEHGGWYLCKKPCVNAGKLKADCMNGCGGWARCQAPCKNEGNLKSDCRDCGGRRLCDNCEMYIVSDPSGLCSDCRNASFSNSRLREKETENRLKEWATQGHIPVYSSWNKQIPSADPAACGKNRPDFTFVTDASVIVLEFDEYQHKYEDPRCELVRMENIFYSFRGLPVTFIRYNPDAFKVAGTTLVTKRETREGVLLDVLKKAFANEDFAHAIVVHYVCYDAAAGSDSNYVQTHRFVDVLEYEAWVEATAPA